MNDTKTKPKPVSRLIADDGEIYANVEELADWIEAAGPQFAKTAMRIRELATKDGVPR